MIDTCMYDKEAHLHIANPTVQCGQKTRLKDRNTPRRVILIQNWVSPFSISLNLTYPPGLPSQILMLCSCVVGTCSGVHTCVEGRNQRGKGAQGPESPRADDGACRADVRRSDHLTISAPPICEYGDHWLRMLAKVKGIPPHLYGTVLLPVKPTLECITACALQHYPLSTTHSRRERPTSTFLPVRPFVGAPTPKSTPLVSTGTPTFPGPSRARERTSDHRTRDWPRYKVPCLMPTRVYKDTVTSRHYGTHPEPANPLSDSRG